nr:ABC transporter ATP-binding protein [Microvirga pakistanensis]
MVEAVTAPVLSVQDLWVEARTPNGLRPILEDVSFTLAPRETLCLAGESGSGKSVTSLAIMRLLPKSSLRVARGSIQLSGRDLLSLSEAEMRKVRGGDVAMIFQEPMTSLNPVMTIGAQMSEAIRIHQGVGEQEALARSKDMLDAVHITDPARRLRQYPHELSGGMRQRVMIGMALSCRPKVLIADEPTTALDVRVQAQILRLMRELSADFGTSTILITHDMGVVAEMADRVVMMKTGRIVETSPVDDIFLCPKAAYTRELLSAVPRLGERKGTDGPPVLSAEREPVQKDAAAPVLVVRDLNVSFQQPGSLLGPRPAPVQAVKDVSFSIPAGQTLGLVGESGSGKSTTGKAIANLIPWTGDILVGGRSIRNLSTRELKAVRRKVQMIFQDPYASLDPRMSVGALIAEPLAIHGIGSRREREERVAQVLQQVRLSPDHRTRYPHEFSGGQRQRICIARALILEPELIIADESVAALDVSVRAQVLDLMLELQESLGLAYLFISHDMAIIERMSHAVAVMRYGRIVEIGSRREVFENPREVYTRELMDAVPIPDPTFARSKRRQGLLVSDEAI